MQRQLITHPHFAKIVSGCQTIARINAQTDGMWAMHDTRGFLGLASREVAANWLAALATVEALQSIAAASQEVKHAAR